MFLFLSLQLLEPHMQTLHRRHNFGDFRQNFNLSTLRAPLFPVISPAIADDCNISEAAPTTNSRLLEELMDDIVELSASKDIQSAGGLYPPLVFAMAPYFDFHIEFPSDCQIENGSKTLVDDTFTVKFVKVLNSEVNYLDLVIRSGLPGGVTISEICLSYVLLVPDDNNSCVDSAFMLEEENLSGKQDATVMRFNIGEAGLHRANSLNVECRGGEMSFSATAENPSYLIAAGTRYSHGLRQRSVASKFGVESTNGTRIRLAYTPTQTGEYRMAELKFNIGDAVQIVYAPLAANPHVCRQSASPASTTTTIKEFHDFLQSTALIQVVQPPTLLQYEVYTPPASPLNAVDTARVVFTPGRPADTFLALTLNIVTSNHLWKGLQQSGINNVDNANLRTNQHTSTTATNSWRSVGDQLRIQKLQSSFGGCNCHLLLRPTNEWKAYVSFVDNDDGVVDSSDGINNRSIEMPLEGIEEGVDSAACIIRNVGPNGSNLRNWILVVEIPFLCVTVSSFQHADGNNHRRTPSPVVREKCLVSASDAATNQPASETLLAVTVDAVVERNQCAMDTNLSKLCNVNAIEPLALESKVLYCFGETVYVQITIQNVSSMTLSLLHCKYVTIYGDSSGIPVPTATTHCLRLAGYEGDVKNKEAFISLTGESIDLSNLSLESFSDNVLAPGECSLLGLELHLRRIDASCSESGQDVWNECPLERLAVPRMEVFYKRVYDGLSRFLDSVSNPSELRAFPVSITSGAQLPSLGSINSVSRPLPLPTATTFNLLDFELSVISLNSVSCDNMKLNVGATVEIQYRLVVATATNARNYALDANFPVRYASTVIIVLALQ
jgi:hypothetical protein